MPDALYGPERLFLSLVVGYDTPVNLTRKSFDIGLYTDNGDAVLAFWQKEVGFECAAALPVDATTVQHRHRAPGCAMKINVVPKGSLGASPAAGGFCELVVSRTGLTSEKKLVDPDGNRILLVPPDALGEARIGMRVRTNSAEKLGRLYQHAMGFRALDDRTYTSEGSRLMVEETTDPIDGGRLRAAGYRYLTFHVGDVDADYAEVVSSGAPSGMAPMDFGNVARIAFVKDGDGNWYELARATPTA